MAELYLGSGFRCQASGACGFRVLPASGDDQDLNEGARLRRMHERICRFRGVVEPIVTPSRNLDDRRTALASQRLALEEPERRADERKTNGNARRTTAGYMREPSGRGWKAVVAEYATRHPQASAREIAAALNCRPTTAATYLGIHREALG